METSNNQKTQLNSSADEEVDKQTLKLKDQIGKFERKSQNQTPNTNHFVQRTNADIELLRQNETLKQENERLRAQLEKLEVVVANSNQTELLNEIHMRFHNQPFSL